MLSWWDDASIVARFEAKVDHGGPDECWPWTAYRMKDGYGILQVGNRPMLAHRLALSRKLGRPLERTELALHSCDHPACVNPAHLRPGTDADNMRDRDERGRRAAPQGEMNGRAELTVSDVLAIRQLLTNASRPSLVQIARQYGVSKATICHIKARRSWNHI